MICDSIPDIITKRYIPHIQELTAIKGIEVKTSELFVTNLPAMFKFFDDNGLYFGAQKKKEKQQYNNEVVTSPTASMRVAGKTFVFTGVRDKELEKFISDNGGSVSTSVSSKTYMLIVKDLDNESSKVTKAKLLGVNILTLADFINELEMV
jgi:NAD-dependent DNA ligase